MPLLLLLLLLLLLGLLLGLRGGAAGWGTAPQVGRSRVRFPMVSLEFLLSSFRPHYGPEVNPAPNRNAYQEYLLYGKGGRCLRLTNLLPSCATVMEYRNLNLLEPSGPVHASYGIALPLCICTWVDEQPFVFYGILSSELGSVHVCTDHVAGEDKETLWSIIFLHRGCDESEVVSAHNLKAWGGEQTYSPTHS